MNLAPIDDGYEKLRRDVTTLFAYARQDVQTLFDRDARREADLRQVRADVAELERLLGNRLDSTDHRIQRGYKGVSARLDDAERRCARLLVVLVIAGTVSGVALAMLVTILLR